METPGMGTHIIQRYAIYHEYQITVRLIATLAADIDFSIPGSPCVDAGLSIQHIRQRAIPFSFHILPGNHNDLLCIFQLADLIMIRFHIAVRKRDALRCSPLHNTSLSNRQCHHCQKSAFPFPFHCVLLRLLTGSWTL